MQRVSDTNEDTSGNDKVRSVVRDYSGQALSYVYYEDERRHAPKLLSEDEARRIAANVTKLPGALAIEDYRHARAPYPSEPIITDNTIVVFYAKKSGAALTPCCRSVR